MQTDDARGACLGAGIILIAAAGAILFTLTDLVHHPLVRWLGFLAGLLVLLGVAGLVMLGKDAAPDSWIGRTIDAARAWFTN